MQVKGNDMPEVFDENKDCENLRVIIPSLFGLQKQKGKYYGRAYAKHGDISVFCGIERKFERLVHMMDIAMERGTDSLYDGSTDIPTETFLDTVVDIAVYAMLWVGLVRERHPDKWQEFLERNNLDTDRKEALLDER